MNFNLPNNKILLIAGEVSGDAHAAKLVEQLIRLNPQLEFHGIGGDKLSRHEMRIYFHINQMAFLGISEVIKHLPFIRKVHNTLLEWARINKPLCAILVDYPGFNLKLARSLKKLSIPVVYYISPQLWAWGKGRIKKIKKYVDKMIVLFPFEKEFYAGYGIEAEYVGHPLVDIHAAFLPKKTKVLSDKHIKLGLLPGSRKMEVENLLPKMVATADRLFKDGIIHEAEIVKVDYLSKELFGGIIKNRNFITVVQKPLQEVLPSYDAVMVASGTATLECGLYRVPMLIVYHVSALTYFLGRLLIKLKNIGLVNIVAEKEVASELIQNDFSIEKAYTEVKSLLTPDVNAKMRDELSIVREKLGEKGASQRAAKVIMDFLHGH
jgi:lipid-A-disaccharide synthase